LNDELPNLNFTEASNGVELFNLATNNKYDLIITDINMPEKSGLDSIKDLAHSSVNTPILVLSIHNAIEYAVRVYRAGAYGFLNKDSETSKILEAINSILSGKKYFSDEVLTIIKASKQKNIEKPIHQKLSDREFEIFKFLINGHSTLEIAHKLELGKTTISTFKRRIFDKLELYSVSELTKYAIEKGLA
jgi:two-component system, NarL family, invasion response regulator UvrY